MESEKGQGTKIIFTLPEKNSLSSAPSVQTLASSSQLPSTGERFSPADVEIEKLLDLQESEDVPAELVVAQVTPTELLVDDDRTINISVTKMKEMNSSPGLVDKAPFMTFKPKSPLDDYKVEIRRPRGNILENS